MELHKFNEYKCTFKRDRAGYVYDDKGCPIPETKTLTDRNHVTLTDMQAAHYNRRTATATGIFYERAEVVQEDEPRKSIMRMNKSELSEYIQENGYDIDTEQTRNELIDAIKQVESNK